MKAGKAILLLFLWLFSLSVIAGSDFVFLSDKSKLFWLNNNEIYSADKSRLLYFQKGNIFFSGTTDDRENIYLLATSMNTGSDKEESVFEKDNREPSYKFSGNKFYIVKSSEQSSIKFELLHIERAKKWMAFYSSVNDTLLAYYTADSLPASTAVLVAYILIKEFDLEKQALSAKPKQEEEEREFSSIKPVWGNTSANEWIWDGKNLRPRWNPDTRLIWSFDGQTLKPLYGTNAGDQYSWDGEIFKPIWRTNRNQEWSYDGNRLQPIYSTDWATQYIIQDGVVKPWSNVHTEREWQMDGNIPIPVIILILSGIARPY